MKKNLQHFVACIFCLAIVLPLRAQLQVNKTGKVLIGTQSGTSPLNIYGASGTVLNLESSDGTPLYMNAAGYGAPMMMLEQRSANNSTYIHCQGTMGTWKFFVKGNGYVHCRGLIVGTDTIVPSNQRVSQVAPIESPLEKIANLQVVSYPSRETPNISQAQAQSIQSTDASIPQVTRTRLTLQPQQVETVLPEVVYDIEDGEKGISYTGMIAVLVEALKAQQTTIEELTQRVDQLSGIISETTVQNAPARTIAGTNVEENNIAALYQNTPNPSNHTTEIEFYLPTTIITATLQIYDLQGKILKNIVISERGQSKIILSVDELSAGTYIYALVADGHEIGAKRMVLTK